jgi:prolyl-tRNA synthetase
MIWNMFSKWITSYRDLPLKLNQWANVVRWEMRTRPFLRSSEFLWQEGHTAHATAEEALQCAQQMLDVYASVCKDMLAIPMIKGTKSPSERFAGADETLTIEACMQNGWALQSGTSHYLGQNFAKAFDVTFQTSTGERELVYATSWGVSTRLIGALVMTHADDKGLVLPPPVAPVQCVIVPITKGQDQTVAAAVNTLETVLQTHGVRVKVDWRDHMRPGAKYFEWERKGVPLRIDIGPRDVAKNTVALVYRHTGEKVETNIADAEAFAIHVKNELHAIHEALYHRAEQMVRSKTFRGFTYDEMKQVRAA